MTRRPAPRPRDAGLVVARVGLPVAGLDLALFGLGLALALAASAAQAERCDGVAGRVDSVLASAVPTLVSGTLPNGLRFHLVPRPGDPGLSLRIAYRVGSRDERPGLGGVAHLFEHMMFKGGGRVPDGGHFRVVRDVGGFVNATTDFDSTQYWQNVPREALDRVLFLEAERMRGLVLDARNLDNQRAAIREEGLALENLPYVDAAAAFGLALWAETPYGHSPLGTPEELAALTPEGAEAFHATYYAPGNAELVLVGGFDPERARRAIEDRFGPLPERPVPPPRTPVVPPPAPQHAIADDPLAPFPIFAAIWNAPGAADPDAVAAAVLDDLLMGHPDARFTRAIADEASLDAYALSVVLRDTGLLNYVFVPRTFVPTARLRERVATETRRLLDAGPSDTEVCHGVRRALRARLGPLASNEGIAAAIARAAVLQGDPGAFERDLRRLETTTKADVARVAERVLGGSMHTLEIRPVGAMRWLKRILEWLPDGVGASLEDGLL